MCYLNRPREAIPLQGTWFGAASEVAVKVTAISGSVFRRMEKWNFFGGLFLTDVRIPPVPSEEVFG
jgi:hypothetical protein